MAAWRHSKAPVSPTSKPSSRDAPDHGGFPGYVADPDAHAWEIAWNPAWAIDAEGHVKFGL
jgi:hypothetical protein